MHCEAHVEWEPEDEVKNLWRRVRWTRVLTTSFIETEGKAEATGISCEAAASTLVDSPPVMSVL